MHTFWFEYKICKNLIRPSDITVNIGYMCSKKIKLIGLGLVLVRFRYLPSFWNCVTFIGEVSNNFSECSLERWHQPHHFKCYSPRIFHFLYIFPVKILTILFWACNIQLFCIRWSITLGKVVCSHYNFIVFSKQIKN